MCFNISKQQLPWSSKEDKTSTNFQLHKSNVKSICHKSVLQGQCDKEIMCWSHSTQDKTDRISSCLYPKTSVWCGALSDDGANMFRDQIAVAGGQQIPRADTIWLTARHEAAGLVPLLHVPLAFWTDINRNIKPRFWFIWRNYLRKYHRVLRKVTKLLDEILIG